MLWCSMHSLLQLCTFLVIQRHEITPQSPSPSSTTSPIPICMHVYLR